jgi:hypothetical protein
MEALGRRSARPDSLIQPSGRQNDTRKYGMTGVLLLRSNGGSRANLLTADTRLSQATGSRCAVTARAPLSASPVVSWWAYRAGGPIWSELGRASLDLATLGLKVRAGRFQGPSALTETAHGLHLCSHR